MRGLLEIGGSLKGGKALKGPVANACICKPAAYKYSGKRPVFISPWLINTMVDKYTVI